MKVYIAALYARREEMLVYYKKLEMTGMQCTSRWILGGEESLGQQGAALLDREDVDRADALVFIGQPRGSANRGGGRWWEFGYAYARGKRCVAMLDMGGQQPVHDTIQLGHESVFTALPDVRCVTDFDAAVEYLTSLDVTLHD